jgi:hypothetical protein
MPHTVLSLFICGSTAGLSGTTAAGLRYEMGVTMAKDSIKMIANNKKARFDFFIEDTFEAGIVLHGTEVKSLRMGKCSVKESFIRIENGEVYIYGMHISPYEEITAS